MGIRVSRVRLFFIYTSFIAMGSPAILYLILAFWMNMKRYFANSARLVLD
jgi:phage shock protein PspC (stress-responsive transcriptional regulator)